MANEVSILDDADFRADLLSDDLTEREIAGKWGISRSTVNKWRRRLAEKDGNPTPVKIAGLKDTFSDDGNGAVKYELDSERVIPLSEWLDRLSADGYNPDDFTHSHGHSVWTQATSEGDVRTLYANRFSATRKTEKDRRVDLAAEVLANVRDEISAYKPLARAEREIYGGTFVVCASDLQIGKVDALGNTEDTTRRVLESFNHAAFWADEMHPEEVVLADVGDILENAWNTSSQRATNDLGIPHQVEAVVRIMLEGIKALAPLSPRLRYIAIPSNHGRSRVGFKAEAGDQHDDYGIAIAKILKTALSLNPEFDHVSVEIPDLYQESIGITSSGTRLGFVHGHQASSPDRLPEWWKGQALGRGPVADADILVAGHYHHLNVKTTGDNRTLFVCPTSDNGSSWLTNLKGDSSAPGMLSFFTRNGAWSQLRVL